MEFPAQTIVDYFSSNDIALGVVSKAGAERFQTTGVAGHTDKVTPKQVIAAHGLAGADATAALARTMADIRAAMDDIDLDLLHQDLIEQGGGQNLRAITETYFGDTAPLHLSAMARKLAEDTLRFRRNGLDFLPRTPEETAEILRLRNARAERAALRERSAQWLRDVLAEKAADVPDEQETLVRQLTDYLLLGFQSDGVALLNSLGSKTPLRELAIRLLKLIGRYPEGADEFLLANGIHAGFSPQTLEAAEHLTPYTPDPARLDCAGRTIFSIDDIETKDIDDALSCRLNGEGELEVGIYIADPASFVPKDSPLDEAAVERPLSMYLPTTTVTMFPESLSFNFASLVQDQVRPCMAFNALFDRDLELVDWSLAPAQATITQRLTYEQADDLILNAKGDIPDALRSLARLARKLRRDREEDGAVTLNRPEFKIRVHDGDISIKRMETNTPSHCLVSELMILCNNLAARYALINDIPIIYRAQDKPAHPVESVHTYDAYVFDQQVRKMQRSRLSTYPAPHFGLGLDLYTQASSPLRRYADLIIQRQLSAHLRGLPLPYRQEELFTVLDNVDHTAAQNKALEREANTYWTLEYIRRNLIGTQATATILRTEGSFILGELDELCVRGTVFAREHLRPGDHIRVSIQEAHPDAARLVLEMLP